MEKSFIEYNGVNYTTREVCYETFEPGTGTIMVADSELSDAYPKDWLEVEDQEAIETDNQFYYYMEGLKKDPTDAEIILELLHNDNTTISDEQWYNLLRVATAEVCEWHREGRTNFCIEGYEQGGVYSVYYYGEGVNHNLYRGKCAETAAMTAVAFAAALNRNIIH